MSTLLVTGAAGFVGGGVVDRARRHPRFADARIVATARSFPDAPANADEVVEGDFGDESVLSQLLSFEPDAVIHLAGVLGGAAEADYEAARRVNIDATLRLMEGLRRPSLPPRFVYSSSVAVFGPPLPAVVDDDVIPHPVMTYGAQKLMIETALEQFSARGWIDGVGVRLPGVVARGDADARLRSAFLSRVFVAARDGEEFVMPVAPDGTSWLVSVEACADALLHAAALDTRALGRVRSFTMPAQRVRLGDLVDALAERFPHSRGLIRFEPDEQVQAQFAMQPVLVTARADALGFRHDGDLATLVERSLRP